MAQLAFLLEKFPKLEQIHFVLPTTPMMGTGDSCLKLRDLIVEFSRWVLRPRISYRVDDREPHREEVSVASLFTL